ncbi:hypothetical protein T439DRAFT_353679 [Meredithblackwellia eburnea MCA 4105]
MASKTHQISPELQLELRLRFLETLLSPSVASRSALQPAAAVPASITRRADQLQAQLKQAIESGGGGEVVRRFVQGYDLNEPLLRPPDATTSALDQLTPQAKVALILESEAEIRQLERELREVDTIDQRGVVGAGDLAKHEELKPSLKDLAGNVAPISERYSALELKTTTLLSRYNDYISTLSEIFVSWNDIISSAEEEVARIESERAKGDDVS